MSAYELTRLIESYLFSSCLVDMLILKHIVETRIPHCGQPSLSLKEESRLSSILTLGDFGGEKLTLEFV